MDADSRLIKTFVFHGGNCYFVSTIDRDSSSIMGGRFAETLVWLFDWDKNERLGMTGWQESAGEGSIRGHQSMVERIHRTGSGEVPEEQEPTP